MLFNSYSFLFVYLPLTFAGFFALARLGTRPAAAWLAAASLVFYGSWNPAYVPLLLGSILVNFHVGGAIARDVASGRTRRARGLLTAAIAANLALLGYYKYAGFLVHNVAALTGVQWSIGAIALPLGISFFTFTQIAFLVDAQRGLVREHSFTRYVLFVTYFPHLVAGPVLHHAQMMPQFADAATYRVRSENLAFGLTVFAIGLFKKVVIADSFAPYANAAFDAAQDGVALNLAEAWIGTLAYALQLYFDFSGYCDMAIGLSRLFNVRLPLNFDSPYKAHNIVEFWRRWHMTLSQFLRDYLYIPLGGNRRGHVRRHVNLLATMLLGGLWHGAAWTFVAWGGLHGLYLVVNHLWQSWRQHRSREGEQRREPQAAGGAGRLAATALTFVAVLVAWVFFRAEDFPSAITMLQGMAGLNGFSLPQSLRGAATLSAHLRFDGLFPHLPWEPRAVLSCVTTGLAIVWLLPNAQQFMCEAQARGIAALLPRWRPTLTTATFAAGVLAYATLQIDKVSPFLYFQF